MKPIFVAGTGVRAAKCQEMHLFLSALVQMDSQEARAKQVRFLLDLYMLTVLDKIGHNILYKKQQRTKQYARLNSELICVTGARCNNDGTCREAPMSVTGFECTCPDGFTGSTCETGRLF